MEKRLSAQLLDKINQILNHLGYQVCYSIASLELKTIVGTHISYDYSGTFYIGDRHESSIAINSEKGYTALICSVNCEKYIIVRIDDKTTNLQSFNIRYVTNRREGIHRFDNVCELSFGSKNGQPSLEMGIRQVDNSNDLVEDIPMSWRYLTLNDEDIHGKERLLHIYTEKGALNCSNHVDKTNHHTFEVMAEKNGYVMHETASIEGQQKEKSWAIDNIDEYVRGLLSSTFAKGIFSDVCQTLNSSTPGIIDCLYTLFPEFQKMCDDISKSEPLLEFVVSDEAPTQKPKGKLLSLFGKLRQRKHL